jgi:hypothetical protein
MLGSESAITGMPVWCDAEDFYAIHPDESGNGFRELGTFPSVFLAKRAVEQAVLGSVGRMTKSAGSGMWVS